MADDVIMGCGRKCARLTLGRLMGVVQDSRNAAPLEERLLNHAIAPS